MPTWAVLVVMSVAAARGTGGVELKCGKDHACDMLPGSMRTFRQTTPPPVDFVNIYIHVYTCVHMYICIHVCLYIHTYIHTYIHVYIYIYHIVQTWATPRSHDTSSAARANLWLCSSPMPSSGIYACNAMNVHHNLQGESAYNDCVCVCLSVSSVSVSVSVPFPVPVYV
jgi:hypothetical protein